MSGDVEQGKCDICQKEDVPLSRQYYYYDIQCDCCNKKEDDHFEYISCCINCEPKPPAVITCVISPLEDKEAFKGNSQNFN